MKKLIAAAVIPALLVPVFASCSGQEPAESTVPTYLVTEAPETDEYGREITTEEPTTLWFTDEDGNVLRYNDEGETEYVTIVEQPFSELSPEKVDVSLDINEPVSVKIITGLEVIERSEAKYYKDSQADYVAVKDGKEYHIFTDSQTIVISPYGDGIYTLGYDENGDLVFIANDEMSWYFDSEHKLDYVVYTAYDAYNAMYIYTFYTAKGYREYIYAEGRCYDDTMTEIFGQEYDDFLIRYNNSIELVQ